MNRLFYQFFLYVLIAFQFQCYILHLAREQAEITLYKKKIKSVIADQATSKETRNKLLFVEETRNFAIKNLYLNGEGGYQYYGVIQRKEVGWNVSATYPLEFKPYTWWFPIAGTVPYKGFFNQKMAREEEDRLKKMGLDTRIRITGAYSTLGWFSDPLLSPHLQYKEDDLAGLVIHEMAHATVYFPGDTVFNESYASFLEEEGVKLFFLTREGIHSKTLEHRNKNKIMNDLLRKKIFATANILNDLYHSEQEENEKIKRKKAIIQNFKENILSDPVLSKFVNKEKFTHKELNNEDFAGVLRYHSGTNFFRKKLEELHGDFQKFHLEMEKLKKMDPEKRKLLLANT